MAPSTAPTINAEFPAPKNETANPAKDPMPAPTTATITRFHMCFLTYHSSRGSGGWAPGGPDWEWGR